MAEEKPQYLRILRLFFWELCLLFWGDVVENEYAKFKSLCSAGLKETKENLFFVNDVIEKGLEIEVQNGFYQVIEPLEPLSTDLICLQLSPEVKKKIAFLKIFYQVDSTNDLLIKEKLNRSNAFSILLAEYQSNGKGRRDRKWISPIGTNIYLSIKFIQLSSDKIHLLPLLTGIEVCKCLSQALDVDCQIKWPNDIYLDGRKLGGILIESRYNSYSGHEVVVGLGLNVNMLANDKIDQSWISLRTKLGKYFNRNRLTSSLISRLIERYSNISQLDALKFVSEWQEHDFLLGRNINVIEDNVSYRAIAKGISEDGALLIEYYDKAQYKVSKTKITKTLLSADVSVRKA